MGARMPFVPRVGRRVLPAMVIALVLSLLAAVLPGGVARADSYGELARIGSKEPGTGAGQFNSERTRLLGVDPTDNSVYVLDEPERYSQEKKEVIDPDTKKCEENEVTGKCVMEGVGPITRHFRIQKLIPEKAAYVFSADVAFDQVSPDANLYSNAFLSAGVEGIAVDTKLKRIYVLTADNRAKTATIDNSRKSGSSTQGVLAASTLYAFSTEATGGKLQPASGTKAGGILAGPSELETQSNTPGKALLQPSGISVDPATDEVILLGHVDTKGEAVDNIASAGDHYALQRIKSDGSLGARYLDSKDFFKSGAAPVPVPDSPVVVPGGTERVYVNFRGLAEVPYDFTSTASPRAVSARVSGPPFENGVAYGPNPSSQLETEGVAGGVLSAASDGSTVYAMGEIKTEELIFPDRRSGVLALSATDGSEFGWTGGQTPLLEGAKDKCATQPSLNEFPELPLRIAAGSEGKVFVLNPEFLKRWEGDEAKTVEEEEERAVEGEKTPGPFFAGVIEFGASGTGCPHASVLPPTAEANGKPLTEKQSIPAGSSVTFSSGVKEVEPGVKQGDALKVEWEFTSGETKETATVSGDERQLPKVTHKFDHAGTYTFKETVHTDNLATPVVSVEAGEKVVVTQAPPPEKPLVEGLSGALVGQSVTFSDPNPGGISKYKWSFGDGANEETATPQAKHAYTHTGNYTVELVVANSEGKESPPGIHNIVVSEPPPKQPPPTEPPPKQPPPTEQPKEESKPQLGGGGVLSYRVSIAGTSLSVSPRGMFPLKVNCAGQSACSGTVTLRTLKAVAAGKHKSVLTLAKGSFSIAGGKIKVLTLRLSARARSLLAHMHLLRARATIAGRDSTGVAHTTQFTVTLRPARGKRH
jgi:PKD repeat protein